MEPAPEKRPVRVTILNQQYTVVTAEDPSAIQTLAAEVDELMFSIADRAPNADSTRIAVLAALHLADRVHTLERELEIMKTRTEQFAGLLEQVITEEA